MYDFSTAATTSTKAWFFEAHVYVVCLLPIVYLPSGHS